MNDDEVLAASLGFTGLIESNRDQMNSAVRQAISFYLKKLGYKEKDIALMQKKSRASIYHQVKKFESLLEVKDPLAVALWSKLNFS